jgi:hypothetical protein
MKTIVVIAALALASPAYALDAPQCAPTSDLSIAVSKCDPDPGAMDVERDVLLGELAVCVHCL